MDDTAAGLLGGGIFLFMCVFYLAIYLYVGYSLMVIARKTNTENGWFGFIPILNIILMLNIAQKPIWWIVLCIIPLVNIVIFILVWMGIAEQRGKPGWLGVLILIPLANLILPGYLAFSE